MSTAAVVLAAGGGTRFTGPTHKLLAQLGGEPLVTHAVTAALQARFDETIVIVGAPEVRDALVEGITVVDNPRWREGLATSLALAVDCAAQAGHDVVVVGLADQPFVVADAWRAVAAATTAIAVATYDGRRGHPVRLASEVWPLLPRSGFEGARALMRLRPELVSEVPCPGDPTDIDTAEDLRRWS